MGMFDWIQFGCPSCGHKIKLQSKTGPCNLNVYELRSAPFSVLSDINDSSGECKSCGKKWHIHIQHIVQVVVDE